MATRERKIRKTNFHGFLHAKLSINTWKLRHATGARLRDKFVIISRNFYNLQFFKRNRLWNFVIKVSQHFIGAEHFVLFREHSSIRKALILYETFFQPFRCVLCITSKGKESFISILERELISWLVDIFHRNGWKTSEFNKARLAQRPP